MNDPDLDVVPPHMLRTLRIIVGALVASVLIAAAIFFVVRSQNPAPMANQVPIISCLAVGFAAMMFAVRAVMIPVVSKAGRQKLLANSDVTTTKLMELHISRTIVGAALLEGPAFFLLVAYLTEGQPWTLAAALVMAGLIAVLHFPTRFRVENAIAADRQAIRDEGV
jgi:hypothetical protein